MKLETWIDIAFKLIITVIIALLIMLIHWNHSRITELENDVYFYYEAPGEKDGDEL